MTENKDMPFSDSVRSLLKQVVLKCLIEVRDGNFEGLQEKINACKDAMDLIAQLKYIDNIRLND